VLKAVALDSFVRIFGVESVPISTAEFDSFDLNVLLPEISTSFTSAILSFHRNFVPLDSSLRCIECGILTTLFKSAQYLRRDGNQFAAPMVVY
jgi:hypothetical protein